MDDEEKTNANDIELQQWSYLILDIDEAGSWKGSQQRINQLFDGGQAWFKTVLSLD